MTNEHDDRRDTTHDDDAPMPAPFPTEAADSRPDASDTKDIGDATIIAGTR